jgi:hypothetical protein
MFKNLVYIDKKTQEEFHQFFQLYCHPDLMKRSIDLDAFSNSYKKLLINYGFYHVRNMTRKTIKIATTKTKKEKGQKKLDENYKFFHTPDDSSSNIKAIAA